MSHHDRTEGDRALGYHWRVSPELVEKLGLDPGGRAAAQRARRSIVAALALAAETDRPWISYSRTRDWYAGGEHYPGCDYTYDTVVPAANDLIKAGLVDEERGLVRDGGSGIQSRMRASSLFLERLGADPAVEHVGPGSFLLMKDEDGRLMPLPRTEAVARMVRGMDAANAGVRNLLLTVDPKADQSNWRCGPRQWAARKVCKDGTERWAYVLPTPHHYLVRILGRGRLDCHGRLYGWHLGLPRLRRKELLLNGNPVAEPDFEHLHPTLLYAIAGVPLTWDPYLTGVIERDHAKLALNIAINAKGGRGGAIQAIADHPKWRKEWKLTHADARRAYDEVAKLNKPISHLLGSDAGVRLMGFDSRMCLSVLKGCREAGIAALPVHDSFIVPSAKEGDVKAIMDEALHAVRVEISPGTSSTSVKSILQVPFAPRAAASRPSSSREAKPKRSVASPKKRSAKADFRPVQTVSEPAARLVPQVDGEAPAPDWDLADRTEAMVEHFVLAARARMRKREPYYGKLTYGERQKEFAGAKAAARALAQEEWTQGTRIALKVPDRLSDEARARRDKRNAPRPMPAWLAARRRPQSARWAKPEATPTPVQAKPQATLF